MFSGVSYSAQPLRSLGRPIAAAPENNSSVNKFTFLALGQDFLTENPMPTLQISIFECKLIGLIG